MEQYEREPIQTFTPLPQEQIDAMTEKERCQTAIKLFETLPTEIKLPLDNEGFAVWAGGRDIYRIPSLMSRMGKANLDKYREAARIVENDGYTLRDLHDAAAYRCYMPRYEIRKEWRPESKLSLAAKKIGATARKAFS